MLLIYTHTCPIYILESRGFFPKRHTDYAPKINSKQLKPVPTIGKP